MKEKKYQTRDGHKPGVVAITGRECILCRNGNGTETDCDLHLPGASRGGLSGGVVQVAVCDLCRNAIDAGKSWGCANSLDAIQNGADAVSWNTEEEY